MVVVRRTGPSSPLVQENTPTRDRLENGKDSGRSTLTTSHPPERRFGLGGGHASEHPIENSLVERSSTPVTPFNGVLRQTGETACTSVLVRKLSDAHEVGAFSKLDVSRACIWAMTF